MKRLDCATVTAEQLQAIKGDFPVAKQWIKVATWYARNHRWILWSTEYSSRAVAEEFFNTLKRRGHTHYVIVEINLPGADL